jgi:hypothetical protein
MKMNNDKQEGDKLMDICERSAIDKKFCYCLNPPNPWHKSKAIKRVIEDVYILRVTNIYIYTYYKISKFCLVFSFHKSYGAALNHHALPRPRILE